MRILNGDQTERSCKQLHLMFNTNAGYGLYKFCKNKHEENKQVLFKFEENRGRKSIVNNVHVRNAIYKHALANSDIRMKTL